MPTAGSRWGSTLDEHWIEAKAIPLVLERCNAGGLALKQGEVRGCI